MLCSYGVTMRLALLRMQPTGAYTLYLQDPSHTVGVVYQCLITNSNLRVVVPCRHILTQLCRLFYRLEFVLKRGCTVPLLMNGGILEVVELREMGRLLVEV